MLTIDKIKGMLISDFEKTDKSSYFLKLYRQQIEFSISFSVSEDQIYMIYTFEVDHDDLDFSTFYNCTNKYMKEEFDSCLFSSESSFYKNRKYSYCTNSTERSDDFTARIIYQFFIDLKDLDFNLENEYAYYQLQKIFHDWIIDKSNLSKIIFNNAPQILKSVEEKDNVFEEIIKSESLKLEEKAELIELNFGI